MIIRNQQEQRRQSESSAAVVLLTNLWRLTALQYTILCASVRRSERSSVCSSVLAVSVSPAGRRVTV